ncbi:MAG: APC family permease [Bacillaceae bacterium]
MNLFKEWIIGKPMKSNQLKDEKLTKKKALAVFSSDALSSVAYATEEILLVLALISVPAYLYSLPIAIAITILLIVVTISYRQIIYNFPSGGGAYIVARDFVGQKSSLTAGAALLIDYILTVAVSISSATAALLSAFPALRVYKVEIAVVMIIILMIVNLRGIRESASIFAIPTYVFVGAMLVMIGVGAYNIMVNGISGFHVESSETHSMSSFAFTFLILRAFASGCSALTGIEAISNGVPTFRSPSSKNAVITMIIMSTLLATMFLGITFLAYGFGITANEHETVISQIAKLTFGQGIIYYFIQIFTMLILFLAANTAYAGFPQLSSVMASDGFLPRVLASRGDRLVFSNGIIILSGIASLLVIVFQADTHALIPLYAVGVFLSFTIGQYGMVRGLLKKADRKYWQIVVLIIGTCATGSVTLITSVAKFTSGAWIVLVLIPLVIWMFIRIKAHYDQIAKQLKIEYVATPIKKRTTKFIIPISGVSAVVKQSVEYAKNLSDDVTVVSICYTKERQKEIEEKWRCVYPTIPIITIVSPYRNTTFPLLHYIEQVEIQNQKCFINVIIPQFYVKKWWHIILHNQSGLLIRSLLLWKKDVIVSTIPYHLEE